MYEAEITKLHGTRFSIETQIMSLESATVNIETLRSIKEAAEAMRRIRGDM